MISGAAGSPPDGGWQVLVQDGPDEPASHVGLAGAAAIATSSTLHRTWRQGGGPCTTCSTRATCRPAAPVWRTASVAADSCVRRQHLVDGRAGPRPCRRAGSAARRAPARLVAAADGAVLRLAGGWPAMTEALWYLGRGTGVTALVLLSLVVVLGHRRPGPAGRCPVCPGSRSPPCTAPPA